MSSWSLHHILIARLFKIEWNIRDMDIFGMSLHPIIWDKLFPPLHPNPHINNGNFVATLVDKITDIMLISTTLYMCWSLYVGNMFTRVLVSFYFDPWGNSHSLYKCITPKWHISLISKYNTNRARFLSLAQSKLRLCSANHWPGYWSNLPCDWPSTAWAFSEQEIESGPCTRKEFATPW